MPDTPLADTSSLQQAPFSIPATLATSLQRPQTLKCDDTFLVTDEYGDCAALQPTVEGLFHEDTRYLSRFVLKLEGARPLLLSSSMSLDSEIFRANLTNPDLYQHGRRTLERDSVHLLRTARLTPGGLTVSVDIHSYAREPVEVTLETEFDSDFADIFEVRGRRRQRRGQRSGKVIDPTAVLIAYRGLDAIERRCRLGFSLPAEAIDMQHALHRIRVPPQGVVNLTISVTCRAGRDAAPDASGTPRRGEARALNGGELATSNEILNHWITRSRADLHMLTTATPHGPYPYAGIPWFSTAFGRDGIIAALQTLWLMPELARGVLGYLAATQATAFDPASDAEPGKILHEERRGEMAVLGEVPFGRYYGSVDATPLFVMLAAAYWERTGDLDCIRALWPHIAAALAWMREHGDRDGDGFLEYARQSERGLANQGWKDSADSIFHRDGTPAAAPIALVEVQAYAYAAWRGAAALARALGRAEEAATFSAAAERLQLAFEAAFWCEEIGTYALALDGAKRPCMVRSSNAGHALFAGIASAERAARVAATLMSPQGFSGWGIRTIAEGEARYNPMSYHNGSVWPHDNGLIALGFCRYGLREPVLAILGGLLDAAQFMDVYRLPELFCGFARREGDAPTRYPVACIPQAWSAASAFAVIGGLLGISFEPSSRRLYVNRPLLPPYVEELHVRGLSIGDDRMDLLLRRHLRDVAVNVVGKTGSAELVVTSG